MFEIGILVIVLLLVFMILGLPVAYSMILSSIIGLLLGSGPEILKIIPQRIYSGIIPFPLLSIPFFIMTGVVMNRCGMTDRLFAFIGSMVGRYRGGIGQANVLTSMTFGAISGSAVADTSGLGLIEIRVMRKAGYGAEFSAAVTAVSSIVAPIIPPSIPLIIYGAMAGVSISQLFIGGIVPGIILGLSMMIVVYIIAVRRNYPKSERYPIKEIISTGISSLPSLSIPFILLGGIFSGVFTATEAAIISALYTILIGIFVEKQLSWALFMASMKETFEFTVKVIFIVGAAALFGWVLTFYGITQSLASILANFTDSPMVIMILLTIVFLILGTFMETISILILTVPVLMPIVTQVGVDPLYFGVMMTISLSIGLVTPPVGICLFPAANIAKVPLTSVIKECIPFYLIFAVVLVVLLWLPEIIMFLPNLLR